MEMSIFDRLGDGCVTHLCERGLGEGKIVHDLHERERRPRAEMPGPPVTTRAASLLRFFRGARLEKPRGETAWVPKPI